MTMKKYLYETHLHTARVSKCASATVREQLELFCLTVDERRAML